MERRTEKSHSNIFEYSTERISGDIQSYLNNKAREGWRCVSVCPATGLGWTVIVVLERKINENVFDQ